MEGFEKGKREDCGSEGFGKGKKEGFGKGQSEGFGKGQEEGLGKGPGKGGARHFPKPCIDSVLLSIGTQCVGFEEPGQL